MNQGILVFLQVVITSIIATIGVIYTARSGSRSTEKGKEMESDIAWRKQLMDEIRELKERVENLEKERDVHARKANIMGDFLDTLSAFVTYGRKGPYPAAPVEAGEYYNVDRWVFIKAEHDRKEGLVDD